MSDTEETTWSRDGFWLTWDAFGTTFIPYSEREGSVDSSTGDRIHFVSFDGTEGGYDEERQS